MWDDSEKQSTNPPGRSARRPPTNTFSDPRQQQQSQFDASPTEQQPENSSAFLPYRLITPSSEKRQQLLQAEQRGEEMYQQYRNSSRLGYVSESNQLGGGNISEDEVRRTAQQQQNRAKMDRLRKQEELKQRKRREEEEESARIKAEGHRKAELLEQRKRLEAERQAQLHHEQHRKTNDEFLARIERQSFPAPVASASASQIRSTVGFSARASQLDCRDAAATCSASQLGYSSHGVQHPSVTDNNVAENVSTVLHNTCISVPQADSTRPSSTEARHALLQLRQLYPLYDIEVLQDILKETNYNVVAANRLLSD